MNYLHNFFLMLPTEVASPRIKQSKKEGMIKMKREITKKIGDLFILNELDEKAGMMVNCRYDNGKYDYYMNNDIEWLIENAEEISEDFERCVEYNYNWCAWQILVNSKYISKGKYIDKMIRENDIYLFERVCIHHEDVAYKMHLPNNSTIEECFNKFKKYDDWNRLCVFAEIHQGKKY